MFWLRKNLTTYKNKQNTELTRHNCKSFTIKNPPSSTKLESWFKRKMSLSKEIANYQSYKEAVLTRSKCRGSVLKKGIAM